MFKKISFSLLLVLLLITSPKTGVMANNNRWNTENTFEVTRKTLTVYSEPNLHSKALFTLYKGMDIDPSESRNIDGYRWFKIGKMNHWIPVIEPGGLVNVSMKENRSTESIEDYYDILKQPHNFAVKLVKYPQAKGYIEVYQKNEEHYDLKSIYPVSYRKEGEKSKYGDLKTVGGNVVRYMYRTTRSGMNGRNRNGESFGVYKISFPMPHDGLPHLLKGNISTYQYNKLPAINKNTKGEFMPHPGSYMGADIVLHTKRKGSRGCLNIKNELMSDLYHKDMATESDREIIPLIIYDEDAVAPPAGTLLM